MNARFKPRQALRGRIVWLAFAVVLLVGAFLLSRVGLDTADKLASTGSFFIALIALGITLRQFRSYGTAKEAVDLPDAVERFANALREQWEEEERALRLQDPFPLPVRWEGGDPALADHWASVHGDPDNGAEVDLTGRFRDISDFFDAIPSSRLVVLGRAGAGKSALTTQFVLDRLRRRSPGDPVPVVLSVASWNPDQQDIREWAAQRIAADWPALAATTDSDQTIAERLVRGRHVMLVLDGLDEIAEPVRHRALPALNGALTRDDKVLLTSRTEEYRAAIGNGDVLTAAAVVELQPLTIGDLADYLPLTTRKTNGGSTKWQPVLEALRDPSTPVAERLGQAFATPLMASLARTTYSDTDADPGELLDEKRFCTSAEIEDHLLESFVSAVYDRPTERLGKRRWPSNKARRWLAFLAAGMQARGTIDLQWWNVYGRGTRLIVAVISALPFSLIAALSVWLHYGLTMSLTFATLGGFLFFHAVFRAVGEPPLPTRPRLAGRARFFLIRTAIGLVAGFLVVLVLTGERGLAIIVGAAIGLSFAAASLLTTPADVSTAVSPDSLLRADRTTALVLGPVYALAVGEPHWRVGVVLPTPLIVYATEFSSGLADPTLGWIVVSAATACALTMYGLTISAWGRFTIIRIFLAMRGRLPWSMLRFLDDAHERGVLRQAAGVYRFRHLRLQHRLATRVETDAVGSGEITPAMGELDSAAPHPVGIAPIRRLAVLTRGVGFTAGRGEKAVVSVSLLAFLIAISEQSGSLTGEAGPFRRPLDSAAVCALLRDTDLEPLHLGEPEPQKPIPSSLNSAVCSWEPEHTAGVVGWPSVSLVVTRYEPSTNGESAVTRAKENFLFGKGEPVSGLGDEAFETITHEYDGKRGPFDTHLGFYAALPTREAKVTARADNLVLELTYEQGDTDRARVIEIAEILARIALTNATGRPAADSLTEDGMKHASQRGLAEVPLAPGSLPTRYRPVSARLSGETWLPGEDVRFINAGPFVFKTPPETSCVTMDSWYTPELREQIHVKPGEPNIVVGPPQIEFPYYSCSAGESDGVEIHLVVRPCTTNCAEPVWSNHDRMWPHFIVDWQQVDSTTRYNEEIRVRWSRTNPEVRHERYWSSMSRVFRAADNRFYHVGVQVSVPRAQSTTAQKIVNDIRAQTSD